MTAVQKMIGVRFIKAESGMLPRVRVTVRCPIPQCGSQVGITLWYVQGSVQKTRERPEFKNSLGICDCGNAVGITEGTLTKVLEATK